MAKKAVKEDRSVKTKTKVKAVQVVKTKATKTREPVKTEDGFHQIKLVLSHILELLKASFKDALRQYINSKLSVSQPASVEEFMDSFKHTVAAQNITKDELLSFLDDVELELLANSQANEILKANKKEAVQAVPKLDFTVEATPEATPEVAPEATPEVAPKPALALVEKTPEVKKTSVSVFDSLDDLL